MICNSCKRNRHKGCKGGTYCMCQHNVALGKASRNSQELIKLAEANRVKVMECKNKEQHSLMAKCGSCPYGT